MRKYLITSTYSHELWKAQIADPHSPRPQLEALVEGVGGQIHDVYFAPEDGMVVTIATLPDETAVSAATFKALAEGTVVSMKVIPLLDVDAGLEALKLAQQSTYQTHHSGKD